MLTSERRESVEGVTDDIEWAFATLGTDIDPGIALRVATAALPMLGLTLDRVRSEDFFQAGAAVAASSQVGPYSRALWHWLLVDALCYDPTWASRLHSELDALERLAHSNNFRALLARAHLIRASIALGEGNAAAGRASLDAAHPLLNPAHPPDYWKDAWEHAKVCLRKMLDAGVTEARTTPALMQQGFVLVALGRFEEAVAAFARATRRAQRRLRACPQFLCFAYVFFGIATVEIELTMLLTSFRKHIPYPIRSNARDVYRPQRRRITK